MKILDELERLEKEATPEPWHSGVMSLGKDSAAIVGTNKFFLEPMNPDNNICALQSTRTADADLISFSRNNICALIECVRALEWYADEYNYGWPENDGGKIMEDEGSRARKALKKLDGEM